MPVVNIDNEDNDNYSLPSGNNSDDDLDESYYHTHRLCSRHASCNKKKHQHSSTDSTTLPSLSKNSKKPVKGDIRPVDSGTGHRQKYDGRKWRRICCVPYCLLYLNGGIYFEKWLCRKHYLLTLTNDLISESDESIIEDITPKISANKNPPKSPVRHITKQTEPRKRGDLMVNADGIRQKYDGHSWRSVCNYKDCISFIVRHGYCHRHDMEIRKKKSQILPISEKNHPKKSKTKSQKIRAKSLPATKPKKGDIQVVRQLWNGTKWYSLCHYYTRDCKRRSSGKRCSFLCDAHYKEYVAKRRDPTLIDHNDEISISPTVKRKKLINHEDNILSPNIIHKQNATTFQQSSSTIDRAKHTEQCIQTDLTYPLDSNDLRQGCFLIDDDDDNDRYQSESPQVTLCIKKEEEDFIINKRKLAINVNSLSINCKIELTKLEV